MSDIILFFRIRKKQECLQMVGEVMPQTPDLEMLLLHGFIVLQVHFRVEVFLLQFPLLCQNGNCPEKPYKGKQGEKKQGCI